MRNEKISLLTFEEFVKQIQSKLSERNAECEINVDKVLKNNDRELTGITLIKKEYNITPVVYIDPIYQYYLNGYDLEACIDKIEHILCNNQLVGGNEVTSFVCDFNKVKERIIYEVINTKRNKALLQTLPHREFLDLSIVYKIMSDGILGDKHKDDVLTIKVTNKIIENWGVTEQELFALAEKNTARLREPFMEDISNVIPKDLNNVCDGFEQGVMYVLTNTKRINGACVILNKQFMNEVYKKLGKGFYVIPSSIHEVIVVGKDTIGENERNINQMIKEVNEFHVEETEILGDNAYYFDGVTFSIIEA